MPVGAQSPTGRAEAVLAALSKLEMSLREERLAALRVADEARRRGEHGNRAYWSGLGEGYRHSADNVLQLYERVRALYRTR
jgi:hypothetical protein